MIQAGWAPPTPIFGFSFFRNSQSPGSGFKPELRRTNSSATRNIRKLVIETPAKTLIVILSEAKDLELIKMTRFFGRFAPSE
jgi:hypothetical protein